VDFYRKCSCIFVISNRPSWLITPVKDEFIGLALTFVVRGDVGDVWPHKAGRLADGLHGHPCGSPGT
jgi:hypothetical protein